MRRTHRTVLSAAVVDSAGILAYEVRVSLPPVAELRAASKTLSLRDVVHKGPAISAGCRGGLVPRAARG